MGQPVMLRIVSPQPPAVVSPTPSRWRRISGSAPSSSQWSWMFWRVESSPSQWPHVFEASPIARRCCAVRTPLGSLIRSMNVPIFGLSW